MNRATHRAGRSMALPPSLLLCLAFCLAPATPALAEKQPSLATGTLSFALPDLNGKTLSSSDLDLRGKVLLVNLWGTWCPPCLSEIPTFNELQEIYRDWGLVVIGIAFERQEGEAGRAQLQRFAREKEINYIVLQGGGPGDVQSVFPAMRDFKGCPVEILVGRDGRVRRVRNGYGYKKKWARELEEKVRALLAEDPPP